MSTVKREAFAHRYMRLIVLAAFSAPFVAALGHFEASAGRQGAFVVSMLAYALSGLLVALPPWNGHRFPLVPTALVSGLFLLAAQQGYAATPVTLDAGQAPWFHLGFIAVLFALGMRLRPGWAWTVWLGVTVLSVLRWPVTDGVLRPVEAYHVVGAAVLLVTWMVERQYNEFMLRQEDTRRILETARSRDEAETGMRQASSRRVDEVRRLAGGLLERIAQDTSPVTDYDAQQFRLTEAQLRDSIRGRSIASPHVLEMTRAARARGLTVDILDERGCAPSPAVMEATARQLAEIIAQARTGIITVRALPEGDPTAVFIVHDSENPDDDPVAVEIADGTGTVSVF
ncbi:hypothetical protein [Kocuria salsicia]|uniref:hypothetical protein n=1 Tax=Kocuria salsicia TaxID=664639 RepID=UPI0011AAD79B|nr:hypothetical protein [Kocuria salsicia]